MWQWSRVERVQASQKLVGRRCWNTLRFVRNIQLLLDYLVKPRSFMDWLWCRSLIHMGLLFEEMYMDEVLLDMPYDIFGFFCVTTKLTYTCQNVIHHSGTYVNILSALFSKRPSLSLSKTRFSSLQDFPRSLNFSYTVLCQGIQRRAICRSSSVKNF